MVLKKITKHLLILLLANFMFLAGCGDDDEATPEMTAFFKTNLQETADMEAPADIVFLNGSKNGLAYRWDFGDAYLKSSDGEVHTYEGISPDTVHFPYPGTYEVRVTVLGSDGQADVSHTETYALAKKVPVISYTPESILNDTAVNFTVDFLRFPDSEPTFNWTFQDGEPATSTEENPVVQFQSGGDKVVTLELNDGEETLTATTTVTVQSTLSPTLYFTDMDSKQIYMVKMSGLEDEEIEPTGAVLADGSIPMSMYVDNGRIFYTNTDATNGTASFGEIKSFKWDGTDHKTIMTGGSGQYVPFSIAIDGSDLYVTNRRDGVWKMGKAIESQSMVAEDIWLHHNQTIFYNDGGGRMGWGDQNGDLSFRDGELWWSKCSNGQGLFTIDPSLPADGSGYVTGSSYLEPWLMRSFAIDETSEKIYYFTNKAVGSDPIGMYVSNLDGTEKILIEEYDPGFDFDGSGGSAEFVGVTDITILEDYVYWGFRDVGNDPATSGVKRANLDGTGVEMFLPGYLTYGLVVDPTPR